MTYDDLGYNEFLEKSIGIEQISIDSIPDISGENIDRILDSFPVDRILPTGSLISEDKRVILNLKEGYLAFLGDRGEELVRFGKQNDDTFGFFIRKHTGDQIMDEEGIKDVSVALRDDIEKIASEGTKETQISSLPFSVRRTNYVLSRQITFQTYTEIPESRITFRIRGKGIGIAVSTIVGFSNNREMHAVHFLDGVRVGSEGGITSNFSPKIYIQQSQRETATLVTGFEMEGGLHTIATAIEAPGNTGYGGLEQLIQEFMLFGKEIQT